MTIEGETSSDEEYYDAEDATPVKKSATLQKKTVQAEVAGDSASTSASVSTTSKPMDIQGTSGQSKPVSQGRKKFRELRQFMQTEDDDFGPSINSTPDSQNSSAEGVFPTVSKGGHPFTIIEHDTMSLQSLSSLGRIGKILGGSIDPSGISVGRESNLYNQPSGSKELLDSAPDDDQSSEKTHILTMQEPDVIASTKANSLKHRASEASQPIMTTSRVSIASEPTDPALPIAPPRKKKKSKPSTPSQSLGSPDADKVLCDSSPMGPPLPPPQPPPQKPTELPNLHIQTPTLSELFHASGMVQLPSPASTIESLTREFQNSLDLSQAEMQRRNTGYLSNKESLHDMAFLDRHNSLGSDHRSSPIDRSLKSENSSKSSTIKSIHSVNSFSFSKGHSLDIRSATKGSYVVKPQDEDKAKATGPTSEELKRIESLKKDLQKSGLENYSHSTILNSNVGHSSLGTNRSPYSEKGMKERRKSAGDEDLFKQMNMFVRTRTDSGKQLTDMEILEQVTVLNLDTGERVPLSIAEDKLPQCINPLSLHIMRLTSEYVSNSSIFDDDKQRESDEDTISVGGVGNNLETDEGLGSVLGVSEGSDEQNNRGLKRKTAKFKRFLGSTVKKTMDKAKSIAQEVTHARHKEYVADITDEVRGEQNIKLKASNSHKGPYDFEGCMRHVQEFSEHTGPVWCMKFSQCGRLLATAGQDKVLRIWIIKDAYSFFQDMRTKYNANEKSSPTPSQESLVSHHSVDSVNDPNNTNQNDPPCAPFMSKPFCTYVGHTSDLLDVSWSKNYFILSSSMDKTVRLWHICRKECLCCFLHIDFVTAIVFHPKDDRYFLSGSLDGKLRLWNIPDKKVEMWNEIDGQSKLITAANFCLNSKLAVIGSYDGKCIFYTADQLKYHTQIDVRSTRGKNSIGRKISGIEPMPGEDKILVTSNDSRIRLYDLRDLSLSCKYKGYANVSSQIKASFSHDGKYIVSGSENQCIYIWKTHHDYSKFTSVRRDRNDFWEGIKAHNAVVTCAVFASNPESIIRMIEEREQAAKGIEVDPNAEKIEDPMVEQHTKGCSGHVLVSADFNGCIKVFVNKTKPKHSSLPASALA